MALVQGQWSQLFAPGLVKQMAEAYGMNAEEYQAIIRSHSTKIKELHVYDLGDDMLVPCQLVRDLFGKF